MIKCGIFDNNYFTSCYSYKQSMKINWITKVKKMITNKFNLPEPLVSAVINDPYVQGDNDISTTSLLSPPRLVQLRKRHKTDEDVTDLIWALIGNNTHHILERIHTPDCIKEQRFYADVLGWRIGGQVDLYEIKTKTHSDYKVTSVWAVLHGIKPEWENQLNINSYLLWYNNYRVERHQIVALLRDWSKYKAHEDGYPSCQVKVVPAPLWEPEETINYLECQVFLHQKAEETPDDELPPCTPSEMWEEPTKYAVMKKKRKSAVRVLGSEADCYKYIEQKKLDKNHYIEERKGTRKRCDNYCVCAQNCNQYKEYHENKTDQDNHARDTRNT